VILKHIEESQPGPEAKFHYVCIQPHHCMTNHYGIL
jgi:hypothetical protein